MYNYHTILLVFKEKVTGKSWVHGFFRPADAGLYKWKKEEQNPNLEISVFVLSHLDSDNQPIYVPLTSKAQLNALYGSIANQCLSYNDQQNTTKLSLSWEDIQ